MKKYLIIAHSANHYFRLAEYLFKKGRLDKIVSIYPKIKLGKYNLPNNKIKFLIFPFFIFFLKRFLKIKISNIFYSKIFNKFCKFYIKKKNVNVLIGLNGYCLESIETGKKRGMLTIVERACPHINFQKRLIFNEIEKLPIRNINQVRNNYFDNKIVDQMLKEYDECDKISVPSKFTLESFKSYGLEDKIIFNQITPEKILNIRNNENLKSKDFKIFSIGFSFVRKGFFYLIEAMRQLEDKNIQLNLRTEIPNFIVMEQMPKNVNLINKHISNSELEKYYNEADLVIIPSVDEGFGMVGLEAMCLKKPVLITRNVGMKDILIKYLNNAEEYIIEPGNINQLTKKIYDFSENKESLKNEGDLFYEASKKYLDKDIFKGYMNL